MQEKYYTRFPDAFVVTAADNLTQFNQLTEEFHAKSATVIDCVNEIVKGYQFSARCRKDFSIYSGYTGLALTHFLCYKMTKNMDNYEMAKSLTDMALTKLSGVDVSFLTGDAGPLALGTLLYSARGEPARASELRLWLLNLGEGSSHSTTCSLIDGWAGYLYALLFVNKHLEGCIPISLIRKVVVRILSSGKDLARQEQSKVPLLYKWQGVRYLGALYGLSGILMMLLASDSLEEAEIYSFVRPTLDYLISTRSSNANYPSFESSDDDNFIQWCHGSPGFISLFIKASEVVHPTYLAYAIEAAEVVWSLGVLRKGYTLCHGVAGNAYSLLALYRKTRERKYLLWAVCFIEWCLTWPQYEAEKPDRPFSLLKGYTGLLYILNDVKDISKTAFPGYDL